MNIYATPDDLADVVATERTIRGWSVRRLADSPISTRPRSDSSKGPSKRRCPLSAAPCALDIEPTALRRE